MGKGNKYPEGMVDWIQENYINHDLPELTELCNMKFDYGITESAMRSLKKRFKLAGAPRMRTHTKVFPREICRFIEKN